MSFKKAKGIIIGFLIGSALGGAAALLLAPKTGKRLRKEISRKTSDLYEESKKLISNS